MPKVDTKVIYPSSLEFLHPVSSEDGINFKLKMLLLDNTVKLPKIKTLPFQHHKVGVLFIGGDIKELDFNNTNLDQRAGKCDCLAVWFKRDLLLPGEHYDDKNMLLLSDYFNDINDYFALPQMIKILIMGIEQTLLRRVVAVGQQTNDHISYPNNKWISVPKNRVHAVIKPIIEK
jgi:hypothetical protein